MKSRLALVAVAVFMSCATRADDAPIPFIDAHVHLNDEASQLTMMDRYGAKQAVIFWGGRSSNRTIAESVGRFPDRFIAFASISPERSRYRSAWERNDLALLDELDGLLASGQYRGIGEISVAHFAAAGFAETDFELTGPMMAGIFSLARKHDVPLLVHAELTHLHDLSAALDAFPDVKVIWAHGGYSALHVAEHMLGRYPNLYYELSARTWPRHPRSADYTILRDGYDVWPEWLRLVEALPDRFILGTDATQRSPTSEAMKFESVQNLLRQLSPGARDQVGRANILRLCGFERSGSRRPGLAPR